MVLGSTSAQCAFAHLIATFDILHVTTNWLFYFCARSHFQIILFLFLMCASILADSSYFVLLTSIVWFLHNVRALTHCLHTGSRTSTLCSLTQISTILLLHPFVFPNRSILVTDVLVLAQQYYFLARALRHPARYQTCPLRNLTNSLSNMPPSYCVHKCGHVHTSHTRVIPKSYASHIRKSYTSHMRVIHKAYRSHMRVIYESHIQVIWESYTSH